MIATCLGLAGVPPVGDAPSESPSVGGGISADVAEDPRGLTVQVSLPMPGSQYDQRL